MRLCHGMIEAISSYPINPLDNLLHKECRNGGWIFIGFNLWKLLVEVCADLPHLITIFIAFIRLSLVV